MPDWKAIAAQHGVSPNTYWQRVHRQGWSEERAATTPPRKKKRPAGSISERCRQAGIAPEDFFAARHNLGLHHLSVEEIIEVVKERQSR